MKKQTFSNGDEPVASSAGAWLALVLAGLLTVAMVPACRAQVMPVPPSVSDAGSIAGGDASVGRVAAEGQTLHVIIGHSIFVNTKARLRRIYVSDPTVINSVTLTANQIIVTAMAPGVSSLTIVDEDSQAVSYVVSADIDVAGLRTAMAEAMRGDKVTVDGNGGHVVLSGTVGSDAKADAAVKLAALYARDVSNALTVIPGHPKQVRLQVRILEVDRSKALQQGINLFNPGGNTSFLAGTTTAEYPSTMQYSANGGGGNIGGGTITTSNPLNFMLYSAKLNLGLTIQDLESKQVLQILAEPTITTISGVKADFLSGGEFPFPIIQPGGTGGAPVVTIQFRPYGVKLEFTPIVNEDGTIRLKVAPEVSALDYTNTVTIGGFTVPALSSRRAETEVELRSNQSFAISGLLDQRTTDILDKTPGAANIPILGALFKSKNINHTQTELVVVITPTVVDPLSEMAAPSEPELPIPTMNQEKYDESLGKRRNPQPAAPPIVPDTPPDSIPPVFPHSAPAPAKAPAAGAAQNVAPPAVPPAAAPAPIPVPRLQNAPAAPAAKPAATRAAKPANAAVAVPPQPTPNPAKAPAAQPARAVPVAIPSAPKAAAPSAPNAASTLSAPGAAPSQPAGAVPAAGVGGAKAAAPAAAAAPPNAPVLAADRPAANPIPAAQPVAAATPAQPPSRPRIVEVMTLSHEADADAMVDALKRRGYDVAVNRDPKDSLLHLDVGPFTSVSDAETMRQRLLQDGYNAVVK